MVIILPFTSSQCYGFEVRQNRTQFIYVLIKRFHECIYISPRHSQVIIIKTISQFNEIIGLTFQTISKINYDI